jgi:hypothetical protein
LRTWNSWIVESAAPCRFWFSDESSLFTPLIWNVAPRVPVLLKLIDDPEEVVGLFCPEVGFSWNPVKTSASVRKFVALSDGLSMIWSAESDPLISALVLLIGGASPRTVTVSAKAAGLRLTSMTTVSFRRSVRPSRTTVPKPDSVTVSLYGPIGRYGALKNPTSLVTTVRSAPVAVWTMLTVTPGSTPPLVSVTEPWMVPVTVWPNAGCATPARPTTAKAVQIAPMNFLFIATPGEEKE